MKQMCSRVGTKKRLEGAKDLKNNQMEEMLYQFFSTKKCFEKQEVV